MSYHYQMSTTNNEFFDSTNYIPQMQMHHGYQDFYTSDATSSMMATVATSQSQTQPTENIVMSVQNGNEHVGYGGWRQHDWSATSSWTMGTQMEHMGTAPTANRVNGVAHMGMSHSTNHGTVGSTAQPLMTSTHITTDSFRQLPSTNLCYMDPPPTRMLTKKVLPTVHRPLARSTPKPFRCSTCGKAFSQAANLTAHKRIHTGEKPFMCPVCNRPFSQSSSLVTHRRTHTGERPYPCGQCEKAFTDSSTLTKHLRTHTGHKPYVCTICMMKFTQSGNLHRHMKTHK